MTLVLWLTAMGPLAANRRHLSDSDLPVLEHELRLLGGPGPPPGAVIHPTVATAAEDEGASAAFVRNEVTRRPRARDTTAARELEVPVITGEYEDDNKPSKLCVRQKARFYTLLVRL
jgi:hypothetical protein